jgi:hypothetical protein
MKCLQAQGSADLRGRGVLIDQKSIEVMLGARGGDIIRNKKHLDTKCWLNPVCQID